MSDDLIQRLAKIEELELEQQLAELDQIVSELEELLRS